METKILSNRKKKKKACTLAQQIPLAALVKKVKEN